jgi:hypothetical protein
LVCFLAALYGDGSTTNTTPFGQDGFAMLLLTLLLCGLLGGLSEETKNETIARPFYTYLFKFCVFDTRHAIMFDT